MCTSIEKLEAGYLQAAKTKLRCSQPKLKAAQSQFPINRLAAI
jgi:hypothetical protein